MTEEDGPVPIHQRPQDFSVLMVKRGPNAGSWFVVDDDLSKAGRHPDSHIFLDDVTVSRRHGEFVRGCDGYQVRDVGSLNGMYVNRKRIDQAALGHGDEVQIGRFRLVFLVDVMEGWGSLTATTRTLKPVRPGCDFAARQRCWMRAAPTCSVPATAKPMSPLSVGAESGGHEVTIE